MSLDPTSVRRFKQTDDRQTNHATEKNVGTGKIACAAKAIPPIEIATKYG